MTYHERLARELRTYHEWISMGYSISSGQYNHVKYRLHDGDVSTPLYERSQVVSHRDGEVREARKRPSIGEECGGPTI